MRRLSNVKFNPKNDKGINDSNENPIKTHRRVEHTCILSNATDTNSKFETENRIKISPDNDNINKKEVEENDLDVNSLTNKTYVAPALGDKLVATDYWGHRTRESAGPPAWLWWVAEEHIPGY